jgi:hypothetical protein
MDMPALLVLFGTLLIAFWAWYGVFFIYPSCTRSLFRYKLWKIRDDLVNATFDGRLPRSSFTLDLVETMEGSIRSSGHYNLVTFALAARSVDPELAKRRQAWLERELGALADEQRDFLLQLRRRYHAAIAVHLLTGTAFALVLLPVFLVSGLAARTWQVVTDGMRDAQARMRNAFRAEAILRGAGVEPGVFPLLAAGSNGEPIANFAR